MKYGFFIRLEQCPCVTTEYKYSNTLTCDLSVNNNIIVIRLEQYPYLIVVFPLLSNIVTPSQINERIPTKGNFVVLDEKQNISTNSHEDLTVNLTKSKSLDCPES